jgi:hypothetical protein
MLGSDLCFYHIITERVRVDAETSLNVIAVVQACRTLTQVGVVSRREEVVAKSAGLSDILDESV